MADWHYVRTRAESAGIVRHPDTGMPTTLDPRTPYRSDDPIVRAYPDHFIADIELAREHQAAERPIEQATRAPGEKRTGVRR